MPPRVWFRGPTNRSGIPPSPAPPTRSLGTRVSYWPWCRVISGLSWCVSLLAAAFDAGTAAFNADTVFFVCKNTLQARSLRDGKLLWKNALPGAFSSWQTHCAGAALLVYPRDEPRLPRIPLSFGPLTWCLVDQNVAKPRQEQALLVLDPRDGQWLQRLPLTEEP